MIREIELASPALKGVQERIRTRQGELMGRKIVVVGDVGLDQYVIGEVRRISPEAPVPVVEVKSEDQRLGLAANVAQNVASLGGEPWLISVIGQDVAGEMLKNALRSQRVSPDFLVPDGERPTIRKLRVLAEHHHIVRVDYELKRYLEEGLEKRVLAQVEALVPKADAVVIEDYAKGLLSESTLQAIIKISHRHGKKVLLDPNRSTPVHYYRGVDLMTPNRDEAISLAGVDADDLRGSVNLIIEMGQALRQKAQAEHLVITRGKDGMTLFDRDQVTHLPTYARQVFDVTGAGDTVIAALALAWGAGWPLAEACVLANYAAGVVVGKVGCVPCSMSELIAHMDQFAEPS